MSSSPLSLSQVITLHSKRTPHLQEEAPGTITIIITTCTALTLAMRSRVLTHSAAINPISMQWWKALTLIAGASSRLRVAPSTIILITITLERLSWTTLASQLRNSSRPRQPSRRLISLAWAQARRRMMMGLTLSWVPITYSLVYLT